MVLVLRYGFNRDGYSSFDVRGPKALMYMWHIEQAAGGLHTTVYVTPTLADPGTTARVYEGRRLAGAPSGVHAVAGCS